MIPFKYILMSCVFNNLCGATHLTDTDVLVQMHQPPHWEYHHIDWSQTVVEDGITYYIDFKHLKGA